MQKTLNQNRRAPWMTDVISFSPSILACLLSIDASIVMCKHTSDIPVIQPAWFKKTSFSFAARIHRSEPALLQLYQLYFAGASPFIWPHTSKLVKECITVFENHYLSTAKLVKAASL